MMSDCPHCWDTPCTCGYEYLTLPIKLEKDPVDEQIKMLTSISNFRKKHKAELDKLHKFGGVCDAAFVAEKEKMWKIYQLETTK
jgi:hypothetical protein